MKNLNWFDIVNLNTFYFLEGKSLRDDEILQNLPVGTTATMYFKDLGPQLGWTTVKILCLDCTNALFYSTWVQNESYT